MPWVKSVGALATWIMHRNFDSFRWREFQNDRIKKDCNLFIDGDLVETFPDLPSDLQQEILGHVDGVTSQELIGMIEDVIRSH